MSVTPRISSKFRLPPSALALPRARPAYAPLHPSPWIISVQRRTLNLSSLTTTPKDILIGKHTVLEIFRYTQPPLETAEQLINVYSSGGEVVAKDVTFQEVHDKHVRPGLSLSPLKLPALDVPEEKRKLHSVATIKTHQVPAEFNNYVLTELVPPEKIPKFSYKDEKGHAGMKIMPLASRRLKIPLLFRLQMEKIHNFLCMKHPVEVRFVLPGRKIGGVRRSEKNFSLNPKADPVIREEWEWLHRAWPHLHPDIVLKSMPEGTTFWLKPHIHAAGVGWVFGPPNSQKRAWDKKIDSLRHRVKLNIREGKQMEMPLKMRQQLMEAGEIRKGADLSGKRRRADAHEEDMENSATSQRYMVHSRKKYKYANLGQSRNDAHRDKKRLQLHN